MWQQRSRAWKRNRHNRTIGIGHKEDNRRERRGAREEIEQELDDAGCDKKEMERRKEEERQDRMMDELYLSELEDGRDW